MSNMVKNELTVGKFTLLGTTNTTSLTIVTAVSSTNSSASTAVTFTTQTLYFQNGCILNLSTASATKITNA